MAERCRIMSDTLDRAIRRHKRTAQRLRLSERWHPRLPSLHK